MTGGAAVAEEAPKDAPPPERRLSHAFSSVVRAIDPSVVRVELPGDVGSPGSSTVANDAGAASGLVIDTAGNVVTLGRLDARSLDVVVVFASGARAPARVVGTDWLTGVSVVRLNRAAHDLTAARFGDSELVEVGDWALAVGRGAGAEIVAGAGIVEGRLADAAVSAVSVQRGRGYFRIGAGLAGDAPGGPLVNLEGEVVGLCAARELAIPINQVRRAAQMILADGRTHYPYIGVALRDLRDLDRGERARLGLREPVRGAVVSRIWEGAPAARAGLRAGDIITAVDNQETPAMEDVVGQVALHSVGEVLTVGFVRAGNPRSAKVPLGDLPPGVRREDPREDLRNDPHNALKAGATAPPSAPLTPG